MIILLYVEYILHNQIFINPLKIESKGLNISSWPKHLDHLVCHNLYSRPFLKASVPLLAGYYNDSMRDKSNIVFIPHD